MKLRLFILENNLSLLLSLGIICFSYSLTMAQVDSSQVRLSKNIREIDQLCSYVHDKIERRELHLNEYVLNSNRFNRHLPNYFQYFEQYYYTFNPNAEVKGQPLLQSIIIKKEQETVRTYQEFVFDIEGKLIYYTEKGQKERGIPQILRRVYFQRNQVIKELKDNTRSKDFDPVLPYKTYSELLKQVERFERKFLVHWERGMRN